MKITFAKALKLISIYLNPAIIVLKIIKNLFFQKSLKNVAIYLYFINRIMILNIEISGAVHM